MKSPFASSVRERAVLWPLLVFIGATAAVLLMVAFYSPSNRTAVAPQAQRAVFRMQTTSDRLLMAAARTKSCPATPMRASPTASPTQILYWCSGGKVHVAAWHEGSTPGQGRIARAYANDAGFITSLFHMCAGQRCAKATGVPALRKDIPVLASVIYESIPRSAGQ